MARLAAEMLLEISRVRASISAVNRQLAGLSAQGEKHGQALGHSLARGVSKGFRSTLAALGVSVGIGSLGYAAGREFMASMQDAADRERFEVGIASLTNDGNAGDALFDRLREYKSVGADISEIMVDARRAIGQGVSIPETEQLMKSMLDISGSLGLANHETQLLVRGLLQVKSKGIAAMEELRQQIAERGVPIFAALSKELGLEGKDLFDEIAKGNVSADQVVPIFTELRGEFEKFRGGAAKMAQTLPGQWNRLKAEWKDLRIEFAAPIADTLRPVMESISTTLATWTDEAGQFGQTLADGIGTAHAAFQEFSSAEAMELMGDGLKLALLTALGAAESGAVKVMEILGDETFWASFEERFIGAAKFFVAELVAGVDFALSKMLGMEPGKGFVTEPVLDAAGNPIPGQFRSREVSDAEWARMNGQSPPVGSRIAGSFAKFFKDADKEREALRYKMEDAAQRIENRRIANLEGEQKRQFELRHGDRMAQLYNSPFHQRFLAWQREQKKEAADKAAADLANLANFPGLLAGRQMQAGFGTPFGGRFGSAFTGTRGGLAGDGVGQISLQGAVDYLFGKDTVEEAMAKQNQHLAGIERTLRTIATKPVPKVIAPPATPVFGPRR